MIYQNMGNFRSIIVMSDLGRLITLGHIQGVCVVLTLIERKVEHSSEPKCSVRSKIRFKVRLNRSFGSLLECNLGNFFSSGPRKS